MVPHGKKTKWSLFLEFIFDRLKFRVYFHQTSRGKNGGLEHIIIIKLEERSKLFITKKKIVSRKMRKTFVKIERLVLLTTIYRFYCLFYLYTKTKIGPDILLLRDQDSCLYMLWAYFCFEKPQVIICNI